MSDEEHISVFLDVLSNHPKNEAGRQQFAQIVRQRCEDDLDTAVERMWDLPPIVVRPEGEYLALLVEARDLYVTGRFYSCVAMCGIVGERLIKDLLRVSVLVHKEGAPQVPSATAFDQLEHVEVNALVRFCAETGLLNREATKAAGDLTVLRNQYAHARGRRPQPDALNAIKYLHVLVEDTVSVFKHNEIKDGVLVPQQRP